MMMATADCLGTYQNALDCIAELRRNGIDANETTGGITFHAKDVAVKAEGVAISQLELAKIIVVSFGGRVCDETELASRLAKRWS
jgi:hypothetical protein